MRILVTGAGGFAGRHLVRELAGHGHKPLAFDNAIASPVEGAIASFTGDLRDAAAVSSVVKDSKPEACAHLGGISFVPAGNSDPSMMFAVNIGGTMNLLDACAAHAPSCRLLLVSTALVYGNRAADAPLSEDAPLFPASAYAVSKAAAELAVRARRLDVVCARPSNHTGPGQSQSFVVAAFAAQIRAIAARKTEPVMRVGNLESRRDISDVRDVVKAYRLLLEKGRPGGTYNISAGRIVSIREILDALCRLASVQPEIAVDKSLFRPTDASPVLDTSRIARDTGWKPMIPMETTLRDMIS